MVIAGEIMRGLPNMDLGVALLGLLVIVVGGYILFRPAGRHSGNESSGGGCFLSLAAFVVLLGVAAFLYYRAHVGR